MIVAPLSYAQEYTMVPQTPLLSAQILKEDQENWLEVQVS